MSTLDTPAIAALLRELGQRIELKGGSPYRARAYQRAGMREKAIAEYERALQLRPDYPAAHLWLALALGEAGRSAEAKLHADAVIRLDPELARQFRLIP